MKYEGGGGEVEEDFMQVWQRLLRYKKIKYIEKNWESRRRVYYAEELHILPTTKNQELLLWKRQTVILLGGW